ncbi:hypothetical protein MYA98_13370 [Salmonella sp. WGH-01]|nr:hypothetical protein MYA98_13370 [Salmonella sp. WGH-01]
MDFKRATSTRTTTAPASPNISNRLSSSRSV